MVDLVTVGQLTLDDIVFLNDNVKRKVIGGGALYSAVGARLWNAKAGINSITGDIYSKEVIDGISEYEIDVDGIKIIDGHGIELWILHESNKAKQQVPKLCSKQYTELDPLRGKLPNKYKEVKAFHIAPQSVEGQKAVLNDIDSNLDNPIITLDLQADKFINISEYKKDFPFDKLTVFMPSREEIQMIWKESDMKNWLRNTAPSEIPYIVIKMGEDGSLVFNRKKDSIYKIPIYPTANIEDTTGAGDSFCGGLLAGLEKNNNIVDAAIMGTVSASFVVEHLGALNTRIPVQKEIKERFKYLKDKVERY